MRKIILLLLLLNSCALYEDARKNPNLRDGVHKMEENKTKVVLLGTGTPNANPERSGPCVAMVVNDTPYLVDCGPGLVRRAAEAYQLGVTALRMENLNHLFVTHLHSDHTTGYADLILTPWVLERSQPLKAFGPPGLKRMTDHLLKAYEEDIKVRIHGYEQANPFGCQVEVKEFGPGKIYEDANVKVIAFPVKHGAWEHAYGFRFETRDRVVVISGDATPCETLVEQAKGCDLLIHEVYCKKSFDKREPKWRKYHQDSHTSTHELAHLANRIQPKILVLYHQLYWGEDDARLLEEIKEIYSGPVYSGQDLDIY